MAKEQVSSNTQLFDIGDIQVAKVVDTIESFSPKLLYVEKDRSPLFPTPNIYLTEVSGIAGKILTTNTTAQLLSRIFYPSLKQVRCNGSTMLGVSMIRYH